MKTILVRTASKSYEIIIGQAITKKLPQLVKELLPRLPVIITNKHIYSLWKDRINYVKKRLDAHILCVPDGEKAKSISEYSKILTQISSLDRQRRSVFIVAIGGGVIGDLAGFVAATYRRGVPIVQVPTTLLAQIDSSIGGKTAINLPLGKNLVGAYHQPELVLIDTDFLSTLGSRQIREGLSEGVKYGVIRDPKLFSYLEETELGKINWDHFVYACASIKAKVVSQDEKETRGLRFILNFGHTIGHAIEMASSYSDYSHGEAVSVGMVCAGEMALQLRLSSRHTVSRIEDLLRKFSLPIFLKKDKINFKKFWMSLNRDKKFSQGKNRFVLPRRIGRVVVVENVPEGVIKQVVKERSR